MSPPPPFVLFGPTHVAALTLAVAVPVGLALAARRLSELARLRLATALAVLLVGSRVAGTVVRKVAFGVPLTQQLPFHLCAILVFVSAWMLWRRSYPVFEVVYFWTFGGVVQALLTPNVPAGFPHPAFVIHFVTHGLLLLAALYATLVLGFRPRPVSILKAFAALNLYALLVLPLNLLLDTNFLFLLRKPAAPSLLDHLGPWPWYLLTLEGIALAVFALCYLPYAVADRWGRDGR